MTNSRGHKTDPFGTPLKTSTQLEYCPLIITLCLLPDATAVVLHLFHEPVTSSVAFNEEPYQKLVENLSILHPQGSQSLDNLLPFVLFHKH